MANKNEVVSKMAEITGMTKKDSEKALEAFMQATEYFLENNEEVKLVGFMTLGIKDVAERSGECKLPGKEKSWTKPAHKKVTVSLGKSLAESVNK